MKQGKYLLDTCICAYWLRDKMNVRERINAVGFDNCYISELTVAELKFGRAYGQLKGGPKYREQPMKKFFEASVSEMVGMSQSKSFQGTFLGNDKTLTFTKGTAETAFGEEYCAPFRHVSGATIRDLKVAGDIYTSQKFAAGLVARSYGATTVTNCQVGTVIHSTISGDGTHGGFVSMPLGTLNIEGCAYTGRLLTNNGTNSSGGFVGWHNAATVNVSHSLYAPSDDITAGWSAISDGATFVRGGSPTVTNCYYTETMGTAQGTQAYAYDAAPANLGDAVENGNYGYITAYTNGILFDGKYYVAPAAVTLADDADNSTVLSGFAGQIANVTLADRTLYRDGDWNTLCLPFAMDATQIAASSLAGATIKELDASTSALAADGTLTLKFTDATSIEAGKAYIVKWEDATGSVANPVFPGVTISSTAPTAVEFAISGSTDKCQFVGQYSPFTIGDTSTGTFDGDLNEIVMLGANSTLGYSQNARTLKCFRAHFLVPADPATGQQLARRFVMYFGDSSTETGILTVTADTPSATAAGTYTLDGRRISGQPTAKGVYIVNGRKVIIK